MYEEWTRCVLSPEARDLAVPIRTCAVWASLREKILVEVGERLGRSKHRVEGLRVWSEHGVLRVPGRLLENVHPSVELLVVHPLVLLGRRASEVHPGVRHAHGLLPVHLLRLDLMRRESLRQRRGRRAVRAGHRVLLLWLLLLLLLLLWEVLGNRRVRGRQGRGRRRIVQPLRTWLRHVRHLHCRDGRLSLGGRHELLGVLGEDALQEPGEEPGRVIRVDRDVLAIKCPDELLCKLDDFSSELIIHVLFELRTKELKRRSKRDEMCTPEQRDYLGQEGTCKGAVPEVAVGSITQGS